MKNKYTSYEIVIINSNKTELARYNGDEGVIMGLSQNEQDPSIWSYAIDIPGLESLICVYEKDLKPTGRHAKREDFYSGESIKVQVNPKTGEGKLVDKDE